MKSSSSSPSVTSTSVTAPLDTQAPPLSTAPPPPDLKVEFLPEWDNNGDSSVSSPSSSSSSSSPAPPCCDIRPARLSLSSPELLSELKASRSRPLRHVPAQNGLTTVFSGRGGQ
ncbi:hypothetical protein INR49_001143, partial [Caranx melampygus]